MWWLAEATSAASLRPAIVKMHGGGWTSGSRSMSAKWNRRLNQLGYHVFDVDYRMPPPERWKDEVGDVKCALGWVVANAEKYRIDPARIGTMGYSAGGNLAMLAAYSAGDPQLPPSATRRSFRSDSSSTSMARRICLGPTTRAGASPTRSMFSSGTSAVRPRSIPIVIASYRRSATSMRRRPLRSRCSA